MKIQHLAVIFIIFILPISLVLSNYTKSRVQTLSLQAQYDTKLNESTYDALKAYQLNSFNSGTSDYVNSKMRDINASVNTFFNALSTNYGTIGYTKEDLQNYVPAVVYTMYDGYYIYSPYTNTWTTDDEREAIKKDITEKIGTQSSGTYSNGQNLYGLKPYVYYSCRYRQDDSNDVVITYSLDGYISIQGKVEGQPVSKYGYILDIEKNQANQSSPTYKGISITNERTQNESIYVDGSPPNSYPCKKINGTKYYKNVAGNVFAVINGKSNLQMNVSFDENNDDRAVQFYKEASEMRNFIESHSFLKELKAKDAVDINGDKSWEENGGESPYTDVGKIFDFERPHNKTIEDEDSNFNTHRMDVIKYSITKNLSVAITNYNNYSNASTNFQMPQLKETDWDKIMDNISIISFLQGLSIGGKIYNGYSVITNNKNEDVVTPQSIYIKTSDGIMHRPNEEGLVVDNSSIGIYNINTERRTGEINAQKIYYFPITGTLSYDSIVTQNKNGNLNEILSKNSSLAKLYYTALGRERYSMYRVQMPF